MYRFVCIIAIYAIAWPVLAGAESKVAVIDIDRILSESKAGKDIESQVKKIYKTLREDIQSREKEFRKKDQELGKERSVISAESFEKKVAAFQKEFSESQKDVQKNRVELEKAHQEAVLKVRDAMLKAAEKISEDRGFELVVPSVQVFFMKRDLDISEEVIDMIDKELPKVKVNI